MKFPSLGNRKVPKLARLQRIFPASIQLTTSSFGVKDRGQSKLYGVPQLSRQNQKPHGKTENLTAKTKYLTAKPKTSRQKQNTSQQNQKPHGKTKYFTRQYLTLFYLCLWRNQFSEKVICVDSRISFYPSRWLPL